MHCHECQDEWYRDESGLVCPVCGSDFVEIVCPPSPAFVSCATSLPAHATAYCPCLSRTVISKTLCLVDLADSNLLFLTFLNLFILLLLVGACSVFC